ncbi:MAG: hypothetical protein GPOALKHO_000343 [Sodalis sp.]|nr:MAG: hypothetical protein GPOALKHO_000343 [Sodalis sp.]
MKPATTSIVLLSNQAVCLLQMHHHRTENWVVLSGTARVTVDGRLIY